MRPLILCSLLFLTTMPGVRADGTQPTQAPPVQVAVTSSYHIGVEDVLEITVQNHADLSKTTVVLPDGTISYPYVGEFKASGLTLREVTDRITVALSKEISSPQVLVTIRSLHERASSQVNVLGDVHSGKFPLKEGWRVLDLLIEAGGIPVDHPEAYSAKIIRNGAEVIPVDLTRILTATDTKANFLLKPDDVLVIRTLNVAAPATQVEILGEVTHPGMVITPPDGSIVAVLGAVGGTTPQADLGKSMLTHNGQTKIIDLSGFLVEGKAPDGVKLEAGDTLFVPANKIIFSVYGAVVHTGPLAYPEHGITVLTAMAAAGGQKPDANLKGASIVHPSRNGPGTVVKINLDEVIKKGDLSKDVVLQPGDILFIPAHKGGPNLLTILSAASLARFLIP